MSELSDWKRICLPAELEQARAAGRREAMRAFKDERINAMGRGIILGILIGWVIVFLMALGYTYVPDDWLLASQ